ncbi:MAG: hypothetical protein EOO73_35595 [Myxococcales bacterium]|nr:MAG: hypothetical protein EOO73_35595 [Myxococcales bacterium]
MNQVTRAASWGLLPLTLGMAGCGSSAAIVIKPQAPAVANRSCPPLAGRSFAVAPVQDKRGYANPRNVGFTQTGLFNVQASLETPQPAAGVVYGALQRAIAACGLRAQQGSTPSAWLKVDLVTMQLTEDTGFTSESIKGQIRFEVEAIDAASQASLHRFVVLGTGEASGIDTTSDAEPVLSQALGASVKEFLRGLSRVSVRAPAAPAPKALGLPPSLVTATARRLREEEAEERFSTTLRDKAIMALELSLKRDGSGTHPIKLKRHHIVLTFEDGSQRFPLDPLKVQERHRVNLMVPVFAGGFMVPFMMEAAGTTTGMEYAGDELMMPTARNELRGILFFDLEGGLSSKPKRVDLELEDAVTGAIQRVPLDFR